MFNKVPLGFIKHPEGPTSVTCSRFNTFHRVRQGSTRFCWLLRCAEWFSEGSEKVTSEPRRTSASLGEPWLRTFFQIFWSLEEPWRPSEKLEGSQRTSANLSEPSQTFRISANVKEVLRAMQNIREPEETFRAIEKPKTFREPGRNFRDPHREPGRSTENIRTLENPSETWRTLANLSELWRPSAILSAPQRF